ncbi:MAG TPA: ATP-binding cassette domain-containing protein [Verrucomicrobiae bacterium]|nr:ATP-binding cassette domain-containing protein [Verrucomicrobiae bacterium]
MMSEAALPATTPVWREVVPGEPLVTFRDVHIAFDEGEVLRGISFSVMPGETKVLLGVSGAGKTVLMKLAAGLLRPDAGEIQVMGHQVGQMAERELLDFRRHIGFVFQEGALFDSMTVADNVSFRLREEEFPEEEIETRTHEALRFVELESTYEKVPSELSGGMRRRVSIARALIDRPALLFCDSPTAGLDPVTSQTIINLIMRGRDTQGVTTILATHRVQDAFGLANYRFDAAEGRVVRAGKDGVNPTNRLTNVLVLRDGKIYFEGAAMKLVDTTDEYLKKFLASAE